MKNTYDIKEAKMSIMLLFIFGALLLLTVFACKKSPTDGVRLIVNSNIIKYSANIQVVDAANQTIVPQNAALSISGQNADNVYEISGKKSFTLHNGKIEIGINPSLIPVTGAPVSFNLEISADGYLPISQEVQIAAGQFTQTLKITMLNISNPPAGVNLVQQDVDASSGSLVNDEAIKILDGQAPFGSSLTRTVNATSSTTLYADNALATVVLPAGTTFYYFKVTKTQTITGTRTIKVLAPKDTTIYTTTTPIPNAQPITGTGIAQYTPPPTTTSYTYRPLVDSVVNYHYDINEYTKVTYKGKVHVACEYGLPSQASSGPSIFPYTLFRPSSIKMLDNSTVSEDELLYISAVKVIVKDVYFIGTVNGQSLMISPENSINGVSTRAYTWRASSIVDSTVINPYTGHRIQAGDKMDIGLNYKKLAAVQGIVQKVRGQYRIETRSGNGGFYHRAKNIAVYSFNLNTTPQNDIPDTYNLRVSGTITCGPLQWGYYDFTPEESAPLLYGKVISDQALTNPTLTYLTSYFDFRNTGTAANFSTANLFTGITGLYAPTKLDVSLTCTGDPNKPITVKPTYRDYLYYGSSGNSFSCGLFNGEFTTRGLVPGSNIAANAWVGDTNVSFTLPVQAGLNPVNVSFGYKDNKICNTF
jgi:hypothetical protein